MAYARCAQCRAIFSPDLCAWPEERFRRDIYNKDYILCDPPYLEERPAANAGVIDAVFGARRREVSLLDWGGGAGALAAKLRGLGWTQALSCDLFHGDPPPEGTFDVVTCFEVVEHVPGQAGLFAALARCLKPQGQLVFTTRLQPPDIEKIRCGWWYASPRNGHLFFHTPDSLARVTRAAGLSVLSRNDDWHVATHAGAALDPRLKTFSFPRSPDPEHAIVVYAGNSAGAAAT